MRDPFLDNPLTKVNSAAERRAYLRAPFFRPVTIAATPDGRPVEGRTVDISLGGVGVACAAAYRRGQLVAVTFRFNDPKLGAREERIPGRVANFVADLDGNRVGVEFLEPLRASEFPLLTRAVERI